MLSTCLSEDAARRLRHGIPWVYRDEIVSMEGTPSVSEPVQLCDEQGQSLGIGDVDLGSSFAIRRLGLPDEPAEGIVQRHLRRALERRALFLDDPRFCRIANDDGDGLPGLVVDRYDSHFVVQTFTRSMEARTEEIRRSLVEVLGARSILLRNDGQRREQLGLARARPHVLHGTPPRWSRVHELGAQITVDLFGGLSTGYFYDQREVRRAVARAAQGARVLDVRCFVGGLFVHAGLHGAKSILAFDADEDAVELARENAAANGLSARTRIEHSMPEDALETLAEPFDLVLFDSPELLKSGQEDGDPFQRLVRLCVRQTRRGGRLVVVSYLSTVLGGQLDESVARACEEEGRLAYRIARPGLPPDFPTVLGSPGAEYMAALALELS